MQMETKNIEVSYRTQSSLSIIKQKTCIIISISISAAKAVMMKTISHVLLDQWQYLSRCDESKASSLITAVMINNLAFSQEK